MKFVGRLVGFLVRNLLRIAFVVLLVGFIAAQTIVGFALKVGAVFASFGVETVSSVLDVRAQKATESADRAKAQTDELDAKNQKLADKLDLAEGERKALQTELDETNRQKKALQSNLDKAVAARKAADVEVAKARKGSIAEVEWKGKKTTLKSAVADVTDGVRKRTSKVAAANSASVFGEGVPFYGVAIIVATLGYELKTACDTMRDMDDLQTLLDPDAVISDDAEKVCGMKVPTKEEVWQAIKNSPELAWSSAASAYDGAVEAIPSWDEVSASSADALAWTQSAAASAGTAIADGAAIAGDFAYDTGASAVEGLGNAGSATVQGAKDLLSMDCWTFCD